MKTSSRTKETSSPRGARAGLAALLLAVIGLGGCATVKRTALNQVGDALSGGGGIFAADDDPELVKAAAPFSLKLMESVLAGSPRHRGLLTAAASGFTQYAYAFVQLEADEVEGRDVQAAIELRHRARRLYLRGRDFGLRGLEVTHPGWSQRLRTDPPRAVAELVREDVPLLYWTACAWAGATAVLKNDADLIAELPLVGAMIDRALVLDEAFDQGALHTFLITWEMARPDATGDPAERARAHYRRALELTGGAQAGPHVAVAEAVAVAQQNRTEFEALLRQALAIDPGSQPEARLVNLVVQRRARHLLAHADALVEPATEREEGASARADGGKSDIKLTDTLQTQRRKE